MICLLKSVVRWILISWARPIDNVKISFLKPFTLSASSKLIFIFIVKKLFKGVFDKNIFKIMS